MCKNRKHFCRIVRSRILQLAQEQRTRKKLFEAPHPFKARGFIGQAGCAAAVFVRVLPVVRTEDAPIFVQGLLHRITQFPRRSDDSLKLCVDFFCNLQVRATSEREMWLYDPLAARLRERGKYHIMSTQDGALQAMTTGPSILFFSFLKISEQFICDTQQSSS